VVQLGLLPPGTAAVPGNLLVTREITVTGAFRFDTELTEALDLLAHGIYVKPVISHVFPAAEAADAFTVASDRRRSCKVLLDFS
jgi:L-idonate 5-dehydrogenase